MTTTAQLIKQLIDSNVSKIKTHDIGIVSAAISHDRVNVKLKHTINGHVIEYLDVPVLPHGIGGTRIYAMPRVGETVLIAFLQYEPSPQLEAATAIPSINESATHLYPVVITSIDTDDTPPAITPAAGETIILHSASSYIRFTAAGDIEIVAPRITANGTQIPQIIPT